ncbi:MAG TPA: sigma factor-like helix-turn-helix DNA-binding protein, partial [Pseudonocardiaceae bacterium]|nr:sigma factor-like helix-turn-helix DNA-binding protein [Pseudonocardiaceae bacterium]
RRSSARPRTTAVEDWDTAMTGHPAQHRSGFDEGILLRQLITGLEPGRRDAFVLTQVLGLDYTAAAEVCGCPIGTIRSRVARAREDLIRALNAPGIRGRSATGR